MEENTIGVPHLIRRYKMSESFFKTILCRGEFNKYRCLGVSHFNFIDSKEFNEELKKFIRIKKNRHIFNIICLFWFFTQQIVLCNQIYNQYGEPIGQVKKGIIYDQFGYIDKQRKTGLYRVYQKQGYKSNNFYIQKFKDSNPNNKNTFKTYLY